MRSGSRAGYVVVSFDRRGFGASEGAVRQQMDPPLNIRDVRNATTYLLSVEGQEGSEADGGDRLARLRNRAPVRLAGLPRAAVGRAATAAAPAQTWAKGSMREHDSSSSSRCRPRHP
jgi:hypothetical protein